MLGNISSKDEYKNYQDYLNLPDKAGYVPLHYAAASGSCKVSLWYGDYCMKHHMLWGQKSSENFLRNFDL